MSAGFWAKLFSRTAPRTPCAPATTPRQTRRDAALIANSAARRRGGFGGFLGARLGLRLRRRLDRRLAPLRLRRQAGIAEEARHPVGRLRADAEPVADALFLQCHPLGVVARQHRIVGADLFEKAPVARAARVGDDDAVERPLFRAAPREPDLQRHARSSPSLSA